MRKAAAIVVGGASLTANPWVGWGRRLVAAEGEAGQGGTGTVAREATSKARSSESRQSQPTDQEAEQARLAAVRERAREAGIGPLKAFQSPLFQIIGNSAPAHMHAVLRDCELIALDFRDAFRAAGFEISPPATRLTVIQFIDERDFAKFLPEAALAHGVGGYSRRENWVVLFDWRNVPSRSRPALANITTLAHEIGHQLAYNTGLLERESDTPLCLIEGLAMFGETRRSSGRSEFGRVSTSRLDDLAHLRRRQPWITVRELLAVDAVLTGPDLDRSALAYAESWLLVHYLMKDRNRRPQFRNYLDEVSSRHDEIHRLDDAAEHWGDLDELDRDLRAYLVRLLVGR